MWQLLPAAEVGEELHVEALIAVFFGRVDVIGDSSGLFLESGGQDGIYAEHHLFFLGGSGAGHIEDHVGEVAVFQMVEIVAEFSHLSPDAVGRAVFDTDFGHDSLVEKGRAKILAETGEPLALHLLVVSDQSVQLVIFMGTAETER